MSDHVDRTILEACAEVDRLVEAVAKKKQGVNTICEMFGRPAVYTDIESVQKRTSGSGRSDRYLGKPLATVVRTILTARHEADIGPASTDELYNEMLSGGFNFEAKPEAELKRGLSISLGKNAKMFYRLKNQLWGLSEWYGNVSRPGKKRNGGSDDDSGAVEADEPAENAAEFGEATDEDQEKFEAAKAAKG